jgi:hypothetical protein
MTKKASGAVPSVDRSWEIEDDLRILTRAYEIQKDPARLKAVRKLAKEKAAALDAMSQGAGKTK